MKRRGKMKPKFDFYDRTSLKSYNLDDSARYQLNRLDSLDVFTRVHSENVASLTCRICEYLHCKTAFTVYCTICAYLHDIGKIFIPSKILQKPSKLTDEEYEIMKTHTTIGYNMCMEDLKLRPYANGPHYHHEALDGTGYPEGLTEKQIPYEAKIIRVADEYDAIVSKRQYKTHIGISDTLKILIENARPSTLHAKVGKIDPKILKALFKVVIDDVEYEIFYTSDYLTYLKGEIKRLEQVDKYRIEMEKAKKEKDKNYYKEGMLILLKQKEGETIENCTDVLKEYKEAYLARQAELDKLNAEIKTIKKLKI